VPFFSAAWGGFFLFLADYADFFTQVFEILELKALKEKLNGIVVRGWRGVL